MKYLSAVSVLVFLAIHPTAFAATTELDVIYSPFSEGVAKLSVPSREDCKTTGTSAPTTICQTPGASLDLGGLREITIEQVFIIAGQSGSVSYSDDTYQGYMVVNGTKVPVSLVLKTRNTRPIPGTLAFTRDQSFSAIPR